MKTKVFDPFQAVRLSGGCTFEPGLGWWTQVESAELAAQLGRPFKGVRDALYIPTLQKCGAPVPEETIVLLKAEAAAAGLSSLSRATGMWILSETGEVQSETIWIAAGTCGNPEMLADLAGTVKALAAQDCAAWEVGGRLQFTN